MARIRIGTILVLLITPENTAKKYSNEKGIYRVGAVLMDLNDPRKIIARTKDYLMEPEHDYETCGIYEGCVFPTGTVVKDGTLYVYYGTADTYIGLATADFNELLNYLMTECKV